MANTKANTKHTHNTSDIRGLSIPTKVGELENDRGYLTSHQDISGLQTKTDNSLTTTDKTIVGAINELKTNMSDINTGETVNTEVAHI